MHGVVLFLSQNKIHLHLLLSVLTIDEGDLLQGGGLWELDVTLNFQGEVSILPQGCSEGCVCVHGWHNKLSLQQTFPHGFHPGKERNTHSSAKAQTHPVK